MNSGPPNNDFSIAAKMVLASLFLSSLTFPNIKQAFIYLSISRESLKKINI